MNDLNLYEKVKLPENNYPIKFRYANSARGTPHWHEVIELLYFSSDGYTVNINGETYTPQEDELYIANFNELHSVKGNGKEFYVLRFIPSFFADAIHKNVLFPTKISGDRVIKECFYKIRKEYDEREKGFDMQIKSLSYSLMVHLMRNYELEILSESEVIKRRNKANIIGEVITYISKNYDKEISTSVLASEYYLSSPYFSKLFKEQTGMSPTDFINKIRVEKAVVLMENTDLTISDISVNVGFGNSNYFTKIFKRYKNITPKKFRKEIAEKKEP